LHTVPHAKLPEHIGNVGLRRRLGHDKRRRDLGVGEPGGYQLQNLALALGECLRAVTRGADRRG
jgi:hypothetical protein